MNPITHALTGWCLAEAFPQLSPRERVGVVVAAVAADVDGLGIVAEWATRESARPLFWWSDYHHVLAHNLVFAIACAAILGVWTKRARAAVLAFIAAHLHLLGDLVGSRGPDGYQWPIAYWPGLELAWRGQWALNAWQNMVITIVLLAVTFVLAERRGYSPVGMFSKRADGLFVDAIRKRARGRSPLP